MEYHEIAQDLRHTPCPRCGMEAYWRKADLEGENIEVVCPECGAVVMTREQFETEATDIVEVPEPE